MIELGLDWSSVWYSLWWLQERYAWLWSFVYIDQAIQAADISHRCSIWSDSDEHTSSADVISSKASAADDRITIWYFGSTPLSGQCWKNWCWNFSPPGQRNSYMCFSSSHMCVMNHNLETASSSAECSRDKLLFSFVRGQDSTMLDIIWV